MALFDTSAIALMPPIEYRTRDENRREGTCHDADGEREGDVTNDTRAENVEAVSYTHLTLPTNREV